MDVFIADTASTMGNDGFRVLRVAFMGQRDPKAFPAGAAAQSRADTRGIRVRQRTRRDWSRKPAFRTQRSVKLTYQGDLVDGVTLMGATANALAMSNTQVDQGRVFSDIEDERHMEVVFLGADIKDRFFPAADPHGKNRADRWTAV